MTFNYKPDEQRAKMTNYF